MHDLQKLLNAMSDAAMHERSRYHVTLGKMIEALHDVPGGIPVQFADGSYPSRPHSYRGYYSDLSFGASEEPVTASDFLRRCRSAVGETYEGYKGGDFIMGHDTPLWAAPWGCTGDAIVDVVPSDDRVLLVTKTLD